MNIEWRCQRDRAFGVAGCADGSFCHPDDSWVFVFRGEPCNNCKGYGFECEEEPPHEDDCEPCLSCLGWGVKPVGGEITTAEAVYHGDNLGERVLVFPVGDGADNE